jgi:subtilisin family serine protease
MAAASAGAAERTAVNLERFAANLSEPVVVAGAGDRHLYPNNNANVEIAVTLSGPPVAEGSNKATVMAEQAAFLTRVASMAPAARVIGSVQLVANTVFLEMPASDLPALGADRAVTRMTGAGNYEYHLDDTVPYIGAETVQGRGFTGKGVRVAVLDSGIDYTHTAFGGEGTPAAYAAAWGTAPADPLNTTLDGLFPTSKVIGGFDFIGERWTGAANSPPLAPDPDPIGAPDATTPGGHGTHVADIIGGKKGVAPDVQFYAVKVCAAISASCSGIALLQGMDFAVDPNGDGDTSDHVDIINMSLGSDYGQPFDDDLSAAVDRTTKLGVLTVASAGNGSNKPYIAGSPAAAITALSVAQTAVPSLAVDLMSIRNPGVAMPDRGAVFQTWSVRPTAAITAPVMFNPANPLACTPLPADSLTGKIALVNRGTCPFADKVRNVQVAGASAAIIGLVDGSAPFASAFSAGVPITIPAFMINLADANAVRLGSTVSFDPANRFTLAGTITGSSSRGPVFDDNRLKPEIGAPGASVSARSGSGIGVGGFGGTSGAAPMVSGAAALLKQSAPTLPPDRLKQVLINSADNVINAPASTDQVIATVLTPITRIGGGEVRADAAVDATAGASAFDRRKTEMHSGGLSFGFVDVADNKVLLRQRVRVFNRSDDLALFRVKPVYRFADDEATDAVEIRTLPVVVLGPRGTNDIDVFMTIDGSKLRNNLMNSGSGGNNPVPLTLAEYDGYLQFTKTTLRGTAETFTLPWHVLPRKSADTRVQSGGSWRQKGADGEIRLKNSGVGTAQLNFYSLIGVSPNQPRGERGANTPMPDLRAVGVTTVEVPTTLCASGFLWSFALNTWERQAQPVAVSHRINLDVDNDGTDDFALLNRDATFNGIGDGRQLAFVFNLRTGAAAGNFFVEHPTNSATTVLNTCLDQVGLSAASVANRQLVRASVFTDDFYFGGPGDSIAPVTIVPFGERFSASAAGDLAPGDNGTVTVTDFGAIPGTTPELGVMIQTDGDRCSLGNCGGATQTTEVLLVAPPGSSIKF